MDDSDEDDDENDEDDDEEDEDDDNVEEDLREDFNESNICCCLDACGTFNLHDTDDCVEICGCFLKEENALPAA